MTAPSVGRGERKRKPARQKVQIFVGTGLNRLLAWSGYLDHLPRINEDISFTKRSYSGRVDRIQHFIDAGVIDVYIR